MNSTHKVEIVTVHLERHPNADKLSVVSVWGYTVCTGTAEWQSLPAWDMLSGNDEPVWLGAFIPPDSLVDVTRPEFAFLADRAKADGKARIKAIRLRGVQSFGLLVPAPVGAKLGDDVAAQLGVEHYEPPLAGEARKRGDKYFTGGEVAPAPNVRTEKYDLDAFRRYHHLFVLGEPVIVTEKLDGANSRFVFLDGKMHRGSRTEWKKEYPDYSHVTLDGLIGNGVEPERAEGILAGLQNKPRTRNLWWEALAKTPSIEAFCRANPGVVLYGEVYGNVNCIKYGLPDGNRFAGFDLLREGQWMDSIDAFVMADRFGLPWVPCLNSDNPGLQMPYDFDAICALADGPTLVEAAKPGTMREGVVVKPMTERRDDHLGRVALKCVSALYLEKYH